MGFESSWPFATTIRATVGVSSGVIETPRPPALILEGVQLLDDLLAGLVDVHFLSVRARGWRSLSEAVPTRGVLDRVRHLGRADCSPG